MAVNIKKHAENLRGICKDYYNGNISYMEFKNLRDQIFDDIESEQGDRNSTRNMYSVLNETDIEHVD